MTTLLNSFEGGTSGTTITTGNSGGASGNAFDVVTIGGSATCAFDNTHAAHGTLSCKLATAGTNTDSLTEWSTSMGSQTQVWFRLYLYFTASPSVNISVWRPYQSTSQVAGLVVQFGGKLAMQNAAQMAIITTTSTIPLNQWFRVEGYATGSATVGQLEMKLFDSPDATTPTETQTSAATQNTLGAPDNYRYGIVSFGTSLGPFWMDSIGLSNTGYIGPVVPTTAKLTSVSIVPSLVAAGVI